MDYDRRVSRYTIVQNDDERDAVGLSVKFFPYAPQSLTSVITFYSSTATRTTFVSLISGLRVIHGATEVSSHHCGTSETHVDPTCLVRVAVTDGFVVLSMRLVLYGLPVECEGEFTFHR